MTTSNYLTLSRIAFIPIFAIFLYLPQNWSYVASAALFAIASITDFLDGYLARKWNQETKFGAFLDPVADKLMVVIAITLIIAKYPTPLITVAGLIIVGRELVISALREWMAEIGKRSIVAVSGMGKWKTGMQITAVIMLCLFKPTFEFLDFNYGLYGFWLGQFFLVVAAAITLWSMIVYLRAAVQAMRESV